MRFGGLIAAIVFAAIAAIIVLRMSASESTNTNVTQQVQQPQAAPLKTVNVFVAAQNIPIGTSITQDMVAIQPWPEHLVLTGFHQGRWWCRRRCRHGGAHPISIARTHHQH